MSGGGPETLFDESTTSSDTYAGYPQNENIGGSFVVDHRVGSDTLDLSPFPVQ